MYQGFLHPELTLKSYSDCPGGHLTGKRRHKWRGFHFTNCSSIFEPFLTPSMKKRFERKASWRTRAPTPRAHFESFQELEKRCSWSPGPGSTPNRRNVRKRLSPPEQRPFLTAGENEHENEMYSMICAAHLGIESRDHLYYSMRMSYPFCESLDPGIVKNWTLVQYS